MTHGKMIESGKKWAFGLLAAATLVSTGAATLLTVSTPANNVNAAIITTGRVKGSLGNVKRTIKFVDASDGQEIGSKVYTLHNGDFIDIATEVPNGYAYDWLQRDWDKNTAANGYIDGGIPGFDTYTVNDKVDQPTVLTALVKQVGPGHLLGTIKVNYPAQYGIQIWTRDGKAVKYSRTDAAYYNKTHKNSKVKAGDAKKLAGQSSWKVFGSVLHANGTIYYNLGGDQYIDSAYTKMSFVKNY